MQKRNRIFVLAAMTCALLFCFGFVACDEEEGSEGSESAVVEEILDGESDGEGAAEEDGSGDGSGGEEKPAQYLVIYQVHGQTVWEQSYFEGDTISAYTPAVKAWEEFLGWKNLPSSMPKENITVEANIRSKENYLRLTTTRSNGLTTLTLTVHGQIKLAGLVGRIRTGAAVEVQALSDNEYLAEVNAVGGAVAFVCSHGENITAEGELFSLVLSSAEEVAASLTVEELLAFDESGEIVAVSYVIG